jgi:hypothetical protein
MTSHSGTGEELTEPPSASADTPTLDAPLVKAAFGAANRNRLIQEYLSSSDDEPWKAVYKLILWIDKTTGLAHCYESDKTQPGKNWHVRSLRFHEWLAKECAQSPATVGESIDWLFRHVANDYARYMVKQYQRLLDKAVTQRAPFSGKGFPEPGDDPGIEGIIREVLGTHLATEPTKEQWRELNIRVRDLVSLENKRKNIVGEGFEDVLAAVIRRADPGGALQAHPRRALHEIPGFTNKRAGEKPVKVDLALVRVADKRRILVTAKWSTRADREEQFRADFLKYLAAESTNDTFDYVMVTNEFDPARLKRACELNSHNSLMLTKVVHISPQALRAVYGQQPEATMKEVVAYMDSGRIVGLDAWIAGLSQP